MKKSYLKKFFCIIALTLLTACTNSSYSAPTIANTDNSIQTTTKQEEHYTVHTSTYLKMASSLEECIEHADYIVACTLTEIGDAFLADPSRTVSATSSSAEITDYVSSIRTPLTLQIDQIYLDRKGILDDTLTVLEYRGTYGDYTLTNDYPQYEVGHSYLLFIGEMPDGTTNVIFHQASVELSSNEASLMQTTGSPSPDFTPLLNTEIYADMSSADAMLDTLSQTIAQCAEDDASS